MGTLSMKFGSNAMKIVNGGGLGIVFAGMAKHMASSEVQLYACWTIANLSFNSTPPSFRLMIMQTHH